MALQQKPAVRDVLRQGIKKLHHRILGKMHEIGQKNLTRLDTCTSTRGIDVLTEHDNLKRTVTVLHTGQVAIGFVLHIE